MKMPVPRLPANGKVQPRQGVAGKHAAYERDGRGRQRDEHRVPQPGRKQRLLEQIPDVVQGRLPRPERVVVDRVPRPVQLAVRPHRRDHHPVEREQQEQQEESHRDVEEDPPSPYGAFDHGSTGLHAADVQELDDDDEQQDREHRQRDGGALAQAAPCRRRSDRRRSQTGAWRWPARRRSSRRRSGNRRTSG